MLDNDFPLVYHGGSTANPAADDSRENRGSMRIMTAQHRAIKSACRGTGSQFLDLDGDVTEVTFIGLDKDDNVRVAGTCDVTGDVTFTTKPKAKKAKATKAAAPAEDAPAE